MAILTKSWWSALGLAACMLGPILVVGCNFEQRDWTKAQTANTIEAYVAFAQKHPQGQLADLARKEIEQREWKVAESSGTGNAFRAFIGKYRNSEHVGAATKAVDMIERRAKLDAILGKHDPEALKLFVADSGNEGVLERFKTSAGATLTLTSQPEEAAKGYRLQVTSSKKPGFYDTSVVIPSGAKLNLKSFGFGEGTKFKIAKGAIRVSIVNGKLVPGAAVGEVRLAMTLKDTSVVKLASEYTDIAPNVLLHVSDSEVAVTRADETCLKRDIAGKPSPGSGGVRFSVTKGEVYLLAFR